MLYIGQKKKNRTISLRSVGILIFSIFFCTGVLALAASLTAQKKVIEVAFKEPPPAETDSARTLASMVKVRDISEDYSTGGLYLLTHYGDREDLFQKENQKAKSNPFINQTWRYCSIFSAAHKGSVVMGRNWDNQNVGSIIVSLYHPPKGYSSVSFSRAIDLGFPENVDLMGFISSPQGERFLLAPFNAMDGINEHGLSIAIAGVKHTIHSEKNGGERIFVSFLIRKILDQTKTVEEAVSLAGKYVPFLLDKDSLDAHLYITDASGRSVVLEYDQDQWLKVYGKGSRQVLTNKFVHDVPDEALREQCWRYRGISAALDASKGDLDWNEGLRILRSVKQMGTTWSALYSPTSKDIYFSVYQTWDKIYHLKAF